MLKLLLPKHSERRQTMSKLVTDRQFNLLVNHLDAPFKEKVTVHEALDWIREGKRIVCFVDVIYHPIEKKAMYLGKILSESGLIIQKKTSDFNTHPLASSALLDAVLTYLEERTDV